MEQVKGRISERKIRLMILSGYLMLILLLLIGFSLARYQRTIKGRVTMPKAKSFQASLLLGGDPVDASLNLSGITPGDTLGTDGTSGYFLKFTVTNTGERQEDLSDLPLSYTIVVNTTDTLPLDMAIKDSDGTVYRSKCTLLEGAVYRFYDADGKEKKFTIDEETAAQKEYTLYMGWTDTAGSNGQTYRGDESLGKEVELLEIRAAISAQPMDPIRYRNEDLIVPAPNQSEAP